jgi:DNA polymerase (family 10)
MVDASHFSTIFDFRMLISYPVYMSLRNSDISEIFSEVADLLDIQGANPFRVRSYRNASRTVKDLSHDLGELIEEGKDLSELPDIGSSIAEKIEEIVKTGRLKQLEELREKVSPELSELLALENLGPRRVAQLNRELGISSLEELEKKARDGSIANLEGFGKKTEKNILEEIERYRDQGDWERMLLSGAEEQVKPLLEYLESLDEIQKVVAAGSYRRRKETVGDLDILALCFEPEPAMKAFREYDRVERVVSSGSSKSTVIMKGGLQVDLRIIEEKSFGAALYYFTGSKSHNIETRKMARDRELKVNEYGVFSGDRQVAGKEEEGVMEAIGVGYIPPELRENRGEIQAALEKRLPDLVELEDIRGDLHMHTDETDGKYPLEEMVSAALEFGYEYMAITDHSKKVSMVGGLDEKRLAKQVEIIRKLDESTKGITILAGIEVDILKDGTLDLSDDALQNLDFVVASAHYHRNLPKKKQTDRLLKALDNRHVSCLGHPFGRLLGERGPLDLDMEKIIKHAAGGGVALELNANPQRLDLPDTWCRAAREMGAKVVISTDAHSTGNLAFIRYGVDTARRGWLEADDVLNTLPLEKLKKSLSRS